MPMSSCTIDSIWKDMQEENQVHNKALASKPKVKKKKKKVEKLGVQKSCTPAKIKAIVPPETVDHDQDSNALVEKPLDLTLNMLQKDLNGLRDERKSVRKQAAEQLYHHICSTAPMPDHLFLDLFKPMLKSFQDPVEKVRERMIQCWLHCIQGYCKAESPVLDWSYVLPYFFPTFVRSFVSAEWEYDDKLQVFIHNHAAHAALKRGRVTSFPEEQLSHVAQPFAEPSEELRLLLLELLSKVLQAVFEQQSHSLLHPYFFDLLSVGLTGLRDAFAPVGIASCTLLRQLTTNLPQAIQPIAKALVVQLKELLTHRHASVRVEALKTIERVVSCPHVEKCKGAGSEAILELLGHQDENVLPIAAFYTRQTKLNLFAKLDQDAALSVRRQFYHTIQHWLLELPDRFDYETRLLPYLLSALNDPCPDIVSQTFAILDTLGQRYEEEHVEDIRELQQYGLTGSSTSVKTLPPPFRDQAPQRVGTRHYVRARCRRFIRPLLRELFHWRENTQLHAVRLLKCILVFSEDQMTVDIADLLSTIIQGQMTLDTETSSSSSSEQRVFGQELAYVVQIIGRSIPIAVSFDFILRQFVQSLDGAQPEKFREAQIRLRVFSSCLEGFAGSGQHLTTCETQEILKTLVDDLALWRLFYPDLGREATSDTCDRITRERIEPFQMLGQQLLACGSFSHQTPEQDPRVVILAWLLDTTLRRAMMILPTTTTTTRQCQFLWESLLLPHQSSTSEQHFPQFQLHWYSHCPEQRLLDFLLGSCVSRALEQSIRCLPTIGHWLTALGQWVLRVSHHPGANMSFLECVKQWNYFQLVIQTTFRRIQEQDAKSVPRVIDELEVVLEDMPSCSTIVDHFILWVVWSSLLIFSPLPNHRSNGRIEQLASQTLKIDIDDVKSEQRICFYTVQCLIDQDIDLTPKDEAETMESFCRHTMDRLFRSCGSDEDTKAEIKTVLKDQLQTKQKQNQWAMNLLSK